MFGARLNKLGAPSKQAPFAPTRLFADSEGFYNDIQTYSTSYFTDTAGTDPAVLEDTIGLVLDQSQGLVLGPELVTNGTFDTDSDWTLGTNWSIADGKITHSTSVQSSFNQTLTITTAKIYRVSFEISGRSAGWVRAFFTGVQISPNIEENGTYEYLVIDTGTNDNIGFEGNSFFDGSLDNISVKELPGNHLTQATAGARPKLSARYNLLERTEEFTSPWGSTSASGSFSSPWFTAQSTGSGGYVSQQGWQSTIGLTYVFRCIAKKGTVDFLGLRFSNAFGSSGSNTAVFDLVSGTVSRQGAGGIASIVEVEPGEFECSWTKTATGASSTAVQAMFYPAEDASGVDVPSNSSGDSVLFREPDIRPTSDTDQPAYQRVTTATDYDSEGFDPYLQFDQVDDALTATIPAITGGTLVLATRQGIWIDDDINASAGTFSIGPTTYTGGPVGLFSNTGSKLIGPPLLIDRQLASSELNGMIQFYKNRGAGDVFLVDFGLIFDRAGSSILDRNDDPIRVRAA